MAKMFYTMEETKAALGRNEEEIKQLAREGRLREFRDGPRLMFKADQVEALKADIGSGGESGAPLNLAGDTGIGSGLGSGIGSGVGSGVGSGGMGSGSGLITAGSGIGSGIGSSGMGSGSGLITSGSGIGSGVGSGIGSGIPIADPRGGTKDDTHLDVGLSGPGGMSGVPSPGKVIPSGVGSGAGTMPGSGSGMLNLTERPGSGSGILNLSGSGLSGSGVGTGGARGGGISVLDDEA